MDPIVTYTIEKHKTKQFSSDQDILLYLGNVNAVKIYYNQKLVTVNSITGVKSLIFPPDHVANYHLPLFPRDSNHNVYTMQEYLNKYPVE